MGQIILILTHINSNEEKNVNVTSKGIYAEKIYLVDINMLIENLLIIVFLKINR